MPSLIVQPRAQLDIDDALNWYYPRNPSFPRFLAELDSTFDRISQNPAQFPVEADPTFKNLGERLGMPYQTLINMYLRDCAEHRKELRVQWRPTDAG